jgi:hypothetical protein
MGSNPKNLLLELARANQWPEPSFTLLSTPQGFQYQVILTIPAVDAVSATGAVYTKKVEAEKSAAGALLIILAAECHGLDLTMAPDYVICAAVETFPAHNFIGQLQEFCVRRFGPSGLPSYRRIPVKVTEADVELHMYVSVQLGQQGQLWAKSSRPVVKVAQQEAAARMLLWLAEHTLLPAADLPQVLQGRQLPLT